MITNQTTTETSTTQLLRNAIVDLDAALDDLDGILKQDTNLPPLLLAKVAIYVDNAASEVRRFADTMARSRKQPFRSNGNGNGKPSHHPPPTR